MDRILIIGCGGSGKSTLARQLADRLDLPLIHLDRLFWYGDGQQRTPEEFDLLLAQEMSRPRWIIDGNYSRTLPIRLAACDTVIYLDYPTVTCLLGVLRRVKQWHGRTRPDMGGTWKEHLDLSFLRWVCGFRRKHRAKYLKLLNESGAEVHIFSSRRDAEYFLNTLPAQNS